MYYLLIGFIIAFATGFLSKLTDVQIDERRFYAKNLVYLTGLAYGILYALLLSYSPEFAVLFLGIAIAVLLAGKIDSLAHQFAIASFLASLVFLGFPRIDALLLLGFIVFATIDEFLNDYFDAHNSKGVFSFIAKQRLSLEAFALVVSFFTGNWLYFAGILSFDIGYWLAELFSSKYALKAVGSFGTHLVLDLNDCSSQKLSNKAFLTKFLKEIPGELGMRAISSPVVKEIKTKFDEGLSGFVMISESHVSVHTFPKFRSAHVDVFSCKSFDVTAARKRIAKKFSARYSKARVFDRMGERNG